MEELYVPTQRGPVLAGVLFPASGNPEQPAKTVVIAITGIHGNFYSNPFYYNVGDTLNAAGIDFVYAQTCDAFGQMRSLDWRTEEPMIIGSWNERFSYTVDDVGRGLTTQSTLATSTWCLPATRWVLTRSSVISARRMTRA